MSTNFGFARPVTGFCGFKSEHEKEIPSNARPPPGRVATDVWVEGKRMTPFIFAVVGVGAIGVAFALRGHYILAFLCVLLLSSVAR